jgi:hypothetical protein
MDAISRPRVSSCATESVTRGHFYAQLNPAPGACFLVLRGSTSRNNFLHLIAGLDAHTTLSDSRQGRRRSATLRSLPSPKTGLPRLLESPFRRAVPTTPAERTGACVDYFPAHAAFPIWQGGRLPHCHFRGLFRLYSRYGPPDRSAAKSDLCHEAPALPVTRPSRSSATRLIDKFLGGFFLHK